MNRHFRVPGKLAEKMEELDIPVSAVLRRAGLPGNLFEQSRVLVTTDELFAFWSAIGSVCKDPGIALKLGTVSRTEHFHPSGIAALSAESFGGAVEQMARYKQLTCPEAIVHAVVGDEWKIRFEWLLAVESEPAALVDYCFAWVHTLSRHGSGTKMSPLRVEFVQPRAHLKAMERYFGCPIVTGAPHNALVFRAADAQCPFITRNAELLDMLTPQLDQELKERGGRSSANDTFTELVRDAIQQRLTGHRPSIDDIARDLHLSSRTLQRRLQEAGSSYQRVLDDARHQMARYYLGNSVLELNEAAYLLGYEDSNSFVRAFRGWEGIPPGQWRETHGLSSIN